MKLNVEPCYLREHPDNPRRINKNSLSKLAESISKNPDYFEARPILVSDRTLQDTGQYLIIGGHQRYRAALALKLDEVPIEVMTNLTEERELEIMIRDNHSSGEYDNGKLFRFSQDLLADIGVELPKFEMPKITQPSKEVKITVSFTEEEVETLGTVPTADDIKQIVMEEF